MLYRTYLPFKYGFLAIEADEEAITGISFVGEKGQEQASELTALAARQLSEYLQGQRTVFDLPLKMKGTAFQKRVWQKLSEIPYGTVVSYREVAEACECHRGYQAIGQAVGHNPLVIVIPCHRVIKNDGTIGGFTPDIRIKRYLQEEIEHMKRLPD